ncbi:hypothetical protein PCANC_07580 [Puccinia coronata f. sp. avenae]|uniref:Uncharacterized protein n=1 Tax=Puccinia coronata f. sp. avenae TaxID=200324 RepID=A0A2N5VK79_9BASI|nr:hypothetical protein PCANC_07580 [Puccinia coronata f. sp. avenae]
MVASNIKLDAAIQASFAGRIPEHALVPWCNGAIPVVNSDQAVRSLDQRLAADTLQNGSSLPVHSHQLKDENPLDKTHFVHTILYLINVHPHFLLACSQSLDWMAASKFISDAAIQFKLGRAPPSESLTDSNSAARAFGHRV